MIVSATKRLRVLPARSHRIVSRRVAALLALGAMLGVSRPAFAHAHLVRSMPASGARLASAPRTIQLWFSEQPEVALTVITLTGPDGRAVPTGPAAAIADTPLGVAIPVAEELSSGTYTVAWRVMATDGHPSHGRFVFTVTAPAAAAVTSRPLPAGQPSVPEAAHDSTNARGGNVTTTGGVADTASAVLTIESPVYIGIRWLSLAALIVVIGTVAFRALVLARAKLGAAEPRVFALALPWLANVGVVAGTLLIIAAFGRIHAQRALMSFGTSAGAGDLVSRTGWGHAWLLQLGASIVACTGFVFARLRVRSGWVIAGTAAIVLSVTPSLSGHAIATPELRWLAVAADTLHVIAAGGWLGSLLALTAVGVPVALTVSRTDQTHATPLVAALVTAFSPTALVFAAVVVASGIVSAWLRLGSLTALWHTQYGAVLVIKLALVALVFVVGTVNWLHMRGALGAPRDGASADSAVVRFRQSGRLELIAGVLVLVATAILVATPTPIQ